MSVFVAKETIVRLRALVAKKIIYARKQTLLRPGFRVLNLSENLKHGRSVASHNHARGR